jgi:hypothetical protein
MDIRAFYLNAAYRNDFSMVWLMIVGRAVAVGVFWRYGGMWGNVAVFEAVCGVSLVVGRAVDACRGNGSVGVGEKKEK